MIKICVGQSFQSDVIAVEDAKAGFKKTSLVTRCHGVCCVSVEMHLAVGHMGLT
jgi:hypothetical protein